MPWWEEIREPVETLLLEIRGALFDEKLKHYPYEAVGLIAVDGELYPLINQARSPKRFEVSERLVSEAIEQMSKYGQAPVAVYHSHPESASGPSGRDTIMMQQNPGSLHVIVGQDGIAAWMWMDQLRFVVKVPLPEKVKHVEST